MEFIVGNLASKCSESMLRDSDGDISAGGEGEAMTMRHVRQATVTYQLATLDWAKVWNNSCSSEDRGSMQNHVVRSAISMAPIKHRRIDLLSRDSKD